MKRSESLYVRLSDEEIAWIDRVVEMSGLSGSEVIETAIDAYLLIIVNAAAMGLILAPLNVFFRDVGTLLPQILTFWMLLTPIFYVVVRRLAIRRSASPQQATEVHT